MDIKNTHIDGECDTIKKNGTKCSRYSNYGFSKKAKISICKYVFFFYYLLCFTNELFRNCYMEKFHRKKIGQFMTD